MQLTAEQIQSNWDELMNVIENNISSPRKEKLLEFYKQYEDRIILMPAAHKKEYHSALGVDELVPQHQPFPAPG